jgi:hypothetical protein
MTAYLLFLHLFHWALPAAAIAVVMVTLAGWIPGWRARRARVAGWRDRCLLTLALNLSVLAGALSAWGADAKMATYGLLLTVSALAQFVFWRGWRA